MTYSTTESNAAGSVAWPGREQRGIARWLEREGHGQLVRRRHAGDGMGLAANPLLRGPEPAGISSERDAYGQTVRGRMRKRHEPAGRGHTEHRRNMMRCHRLDHDRGTGCVHPVEHLGILTALYEQYVADPAG